MTKPKQSKRKLTIAENMTIYNAAAQKQKLLDALGGCSELSLDLSKVGEMDSAGFQLLLLVKREAVKAGKAMQLTAHSGAVTELLDLFNMADDLGDAVWMDTRGGQAQ